jgi:hypothetical protein
LFITYHISEKGVIFPVLKHSGLIYPIVPANFAELLIVSFDLDKPKSPITNLSSPLSINMFLSFKKH